MSYISQLKETLNKIKYVFTEEYRRECNYMEFTKSMIDKVKLKCNSDENIDEKIERLIQNNYENNCHICTQQLEFSEDTLVVEKNCVLQKTKKFKI